METKVKVNYHPPVLINEVVETFTNHLSGFLKPVTLVDATLGSGGHTIKLLEKGFNVIGVDADTKALKVASERINGLQLKSSFRSVHGNFANLRSLLKGINVNEVNGILMDLGISMQQMEDTTRGFSFANQDSNLDMRINLETGVTASDLLKVLRVDQLEALFSEFFEKWRAKKLAMAIVWHRKDNKLETVSDLLKATEKYLPRLKKTNPATKLFMALRIAVNSEYENLVDGLCNAFCLLSKNGVLQVITFHSGEDKIVKDFMKQIEKEGRGKLLPKVSPSAYEISQNRKARSAILRILIKNEK